MAVLRISAKPIEWVNDGENHWHENDYGFWISLDDEDYTAGWGEGDEDSFDSLEDAKSWCDELINNWIQKIAVVTISNE